jgi:hypothetical protein
MNDVLHMLLGAALVAIGVLASGLADRIRQLRLARRDDARPPARESRPPARVRQIAPQRDPDPGSGDVVAALVAAGYRKIIAAQAVAACTAREQATPESWTAAALRRCAMGGAS